MWGQLGKNPSETDFICDLQPLLIDQLENNNDIQCYSISQIECGWHHSLLLVDCIRKIPLLKKKTSKYYRSKTQ